MASNPTIPCAANVPLGLDAGTVPDVSGALRDWFQPMTFSLVAKSNVGFQVVETTTSVSFWGHLQPLSPQRLILKPEGQRAWVWWLLHAQPVLSLSVDAIVTYNGASYRVMAKSDYTLGGYVSYELCQDWT